jgi:hypothetical protein
MKTWLTKKRIIIAAVALLTATAAVLLMLYIKSTEPVIINITHQAVKYNLQDSEVADFERMTVRIHGEIHSPWFSNAWFEGRIMIESYPETFGYSVLFDVIEWEEGKVWVSSGIDYIIYEESDVRPFYSIRFTEGMREIYIVIDDYDESGNRIALWAICSPAVDLETAKEIMDRLWR